mgnify:CR=1 FL=1
MIENPGMGCRPFKIRDRTSQKSTYFFKKHKKVSNKGSKAGGEDSVSG